MKNKKKFGKSLDLKMSGFEPWSEKTESQFRDLIGEVSKERDIQLGWGLAMSIDFIREFKQHIDMRSLFTDIEIDYYDFLYNNKKFEQVIKEFAPQEIRDKFLHMKEENELQLQ